MASENKFERQENYVLISNSKRSFIASASIRDDYVDELESVTWSIKGKYLYSHKLNVYLHQYIMRKWYGEELCRQMTANHYIVEHMDNDGHNCRIDNLCFLTGDENKAKGLTVDKMSKDRRKIALTMFKDFETQLFQLTIQFNYPAKANVSCLTKPAVIELAYMLYDCEYEMVINDARSILYDYRRDFSFQPEKLHFIDYDIEGSYGVACPVEKYEKYLNGNGGHGIGYFDRRAPLRGWKKGDDKKIFRIQDN